MLEANEVTAIYKAARCKMPCHVCMVLRDNLNNMNLASEDMNLRTPENMQQIINEGRARIFPYTMLKMPSGSSRECLNANPSAISFKE